MQQVHCTSYAWWARSICLHPWVGLSLPVDKEKLHNSCLFSDDSISTDHSIVMMWVSLYKAGSLSFKIAPTKQNSCLDSTFFGCVLIRGRYTLLWNPVCLHRSTVAYTHTHTPPHTKWKNVELVKTIQNGFCLSLWAVMAVTGQRFQFKSFPILHFSLPPSLPPFLSFYKPNPLSK